jgi:transcriptional regulator GlxA family with amidase domain
MHMSFPSYLSGIRVKSAASLLLDDDLSITECAFRAGFQSTTAFNKTFHDVTGYSPREYRKLYRK